MGTGLLNINRKKKSEQNKSKAIKEKQNKEKIVQTKKIVNPEEKAKSLATESETVYEKGKVGEFMRL